MSEYECESENLGRTAGKSILLGILLGAFRGCISASWSYLDECEVRDQEAWGSVV